MAICESSIAKAIRSIEPSKHQKSLAVTSQRSLRKKLTLGNYKDRVVDSYLSGSYMRDTAIAPLEDVDVIFLIDPSFWNGALFSSRPAPDELLKSFQRAVRYRYPKSQVRLQRRSVCLQLSRISLDIVPAVALDKSSTILEIPDRNLNTWIRTSPKAHTEFASRVNEANQGRLKPLVKLLKYWNCGLPSTAKMKSFAIETMATRLFEKERITSVQDGLLRFYDFVALLGGQTTSFNWPSRYGMSLGLSPYLADAPQISNLFASLESSKRDRFIAQALRSQKLMVKAQQAVNPETAWRRVASALRYPD